MNGNGERMKAFSERKKDAAMAGHALLDCPRDTQIEIVETIADRCANKASRSDLLMRAARLGILRKPELVSEAKALQAADDVLREKRRAGAEKSRFLKEQEKAAEERWDRTKA